MIDIEFTEKEIDIFFEKVGLNIKRLRSEKNITQLELALAIGHNSVGHIAKAELYKYKKHFILEHLYKISKILDVDISELIN